MLFRVTNCLNSALVKQVPLSETMVSGKPCVANNPRSCSMVTCVVAECTTFASIHFEYASTTTRLPYGLSVAPSIFQRTLECVLAGIPHVCIFLDDILVTGKTQSEHVANLRLVLKRLDEAGLKLNNEKCQFFNASVVYLGHKIDRDGLHPTDEKVRAIQDAPHPTNVKELRAWLGLLNYYGRFLCNLSTTLAPLHVLLRKETVLQREPCNS